MNGAVLCTGVHVQYVHVYNGNLFNLDTFGAEENVPIASHFKRL